eukprot:COSAG06_NODE_14385_length_1161_cov_1.212806_1_plen_33_part_10
MYGSLDINALSAGTLYYTVHFSQSDSEFSDLLA